LEAKQMMSGKNRKTKTAVSK